MSVSTISQRKLEANRANAAKSTGPKTEEGKAVASLNATQHGLYASHPVLFGENPEEFKKLEDEMLADLRPAGSMQKLLADQIVLLSWKLKRIPKIEQWMIFQLNETDDERVARVRAAETYRCPAQELMAARINRDIQDKSFERLNQHQQRLLQLLQSVLRQLRQIQKEDQRDTEETRGEPRETRTKIRADATNPPPRSSNEPRASAIASPVNGESSITNARNEPTEISKSNMDQGLSKLAAAVAPVVTDALSPTTATKPSLDRRF